ncbi:MAG: hypothetical protein J5531_03370 [Lachnospiraceae bacterium]|nr:hypothetical protein [Lachnospiraceae bacterium]
MKKRVRMLALVMVIVLLACTSGIAYADGDATGGDIYSQPSDFTYDRTVWDKTAYTTNFVKLTVRSQKSFYDQVLGYVYLYPTIYQSNARVDKSILQCVTFKIRSRPQPLVDSVTKTEFYGMTQYIKISVNNIRDDDQMIDKVISPQVNLGSTTGERTYTSTVGSTWGVNGKIGVSGGKMSFDAGASGTKTSTISTTNKYTMTALQVRTNDYVASSGTAEWTYDYISESGSNSPKNLYLTSSTYQVGALAWKGPKDANYYFSNFRFTIYAEFGLAKSKGSVRQELNGKYEFGTAKTTSSPYSCYNSSTVYATH